MVVDQELQKSDKCSSQSDWNEFESSFNQLASQLTPFHQSSISQSIKAGLINSSQPAPKRFTFKKSSPHIASPQPTTIPPPTTVPQPSTEHATPKKVISGRQLINSVPSSTITHSIIIIFLSQHSSSPLNLRNLSNSMLYIHGHLPTSILIDNCHDVYFIFSSSQVE